MFIDNPEALKKWLMDYLPPLCDADPEVLARYCLALVRKNQPNSELKKSMLEQLDVFLKSNTQSFVDKFLEVAKSKSYLPAEKDIEADTGTPADKIGEEKIVHPGNSPDSTTVILTSNVASIPSPSRTQPPLPPLPPLPPPIPHPPPETTPPYPPTTKKEEVTSSIKARKSSSERDRDDRRPRRRSRSAGHTRSRSRDKSRSRSRDRSRRSRSRGRSNRSKYDDRRRLKRYRTRSRSPRWSRSPPSRRSRSRERRSRSRNRSRSHSPPPRLQGRHRTRSHSPTTPLGRTSPISVEEKPSNLLAADKEKSPSPDGVPEKTVMSTVTVPSKSQRCRDYDVQGYCMRGDQCPFDHGADPFVLEGGHLDFPPPIQGAPPMAAAGYRMPGPQDLPNRAFLRPPPPIRPNQFEEYTPSNPSLWGNGVMPPFMRGRHLGGPPPRFTGPPPPIITPERELINIPVESRGQNKNIRPSLAQRLGPATNQGFSGPPSSGPHSVQNNCTLELRKIPQGLNSISHLNQHFSKFGNIINIQVHHEGDPEAALVTFSSNSEASAAYRSTEAVLNNRFIKLFWHNPGKLDAVSSSVVGPKPIHDRLGVRNPNKSLNNKLPDEKSEKVLLSRGSLVKTVYNKSVLKIEPFAPAPKKQRLSSTEEAAEEADEAAKQLTSVELKKREIENIRKQQELLKAEIAAKQKADKQKADTIKLKSEVESRSRQLLKEQMQHVKLLITKLEKNKSSMKSEEIRTLMSTIKSLQAAVETTKKQLVNCVVPVVNAQLQVSRSKSQLDKEILDTELEMYTLQSEGQDVTRVRSRLQQLKSQTTTIRGGKRFKSFNANPSTVPTAVLKPAVYRGRGGRPLRGGRGRGGHGGSAVDRRTTCVNASGFEREDKDEVLAHFAQLGQLTNYTWDDMTPAISVQFESRKEAEKAMTQGRTLGDRLLTLTWVPDFSSPSIPSAEIKKTVRSPPDAAAFEDTEEITEEIVDVEEGAEESLLFGEDEIDEEENEGRSWRR